MSRPLRSVLIGDVDYYPSEFIFGVNQGMTLLGHWHTTINIRQPIEMIRRRLDQVHPDVIWGHMLLWAPNGLMHTQEILSLCDERRSHGAVVILHDGDARSETRFPQDISTAVDLVLCNHTYDRSVWCVRQIRWPYFAFVQHEIAAQEPDFMCDLAFAGRLSAEGIYTERTRIVTTLRYMSDLSVKVFPSETVVHTLFRTPTLAASAGSVLGYGRPESRGWCDVRVFQYPGAGGVLLHDDAQGFLEPYVHYIPYARADVKSILAAVSCARVIGPDIRHEAFTYVQATHTSVHRVRHALQEVGLV